MHGAESATKAERMNRRAERTGSSIIRRIIIPILIIGVISYAGYSFYDGTRGERKARSIIEALGQMIPGLGVDSDVAMGLGRDPLASVPIEGIDIVGVLEIPSLDIMAPVMGQAQDDEEYFAKWLDGSPVKGHFKIIGGRDDLFRRLSGLKPGDRVAFTDIDGVRYRYEVMTQYHLKRWDEGDNELMLCFESDKDTYFVVGCNMMLSE